MKITKTKLKPPKEKLLSDEYKSEVCQELVDDTDYDDPELIEAFMEGKRNKMTNEDIMNYQKNNTAFRQTKIGKLFATYVSKQQRAERLDAQMEYTDHYRYEKKLTEYWNEAKAAEVELLVELYKIEGLEYARL